MEQGASSDLSTTVEIQKINNLNIRIRAALGMWDHALRSRKVHGECMESAWRAHGECMESAQKAHKIVPLS